MKTIYFDNAATTAIRESVVDKMSEIMKNNFGNPSSTHSYGRQSKALVESSRKRIASHFNVSAAEIIFTSGGTEADNLVLRSAVKDLGVTEIISTKIEHHAVLHTLDELKTEFGISVQYLNVNSNGDIDVEQLTELLASPKKQLVSLMHINNEIGNKLDLKGIATLCKANDALFHSDTVQSVGHYKLDLQEIPIDYLAASAHKFHGPKGVGFAFIRKNSGLRASIFGGEQERGLRAGTESIHNIVGMDEALDLAYQNLDDERKHIEGLKTYFIDQLKNTFSDVSFNGQSESIEQSTYTLVNVCLPIAPEKAGMLHFQLDLKGIACSKGSACQSGSSQNSHVLTEILDEEHLQRPSVRFSFSKYNTKEEVDYVIDVLKEFV
ncbi:cysteine desulfurase family protein [Psychroserpens sp.]|uniref:cysteine desulfurase family protein n=1 Tax=Psychroserpens sp. TaxID=2020870 RepID=UPI001B1CBA5B|nr:cysteine desulfurase family protein [Psychroserpens sp.]MBO6607305.1 cysteine desulfurase [Psychroserpens sp.]MBO6654619.1 cysteine desulfurase [Psychroserpens sp.]MBO6681034.1 cysteine desulfurase [Psychroserpens sp.]MBO6750011.1 cysteine desulfurase [Psychroserpens sp.]MBO6916003.1 cysteine desulfurase [Psychroserpens sp.]